MDRTVQTVTNSVGAYNFSFLAPGQYRITVNASGFGSFVRDRIPVDINGVAEIDVTLQVCGEAQTVTVSDVPPQLQTTTSSLGTVVDNAEMQAIPLSSRNFTQILTLSSGVTTSASVHRTDRLPEELWMDWCCRRMFPPGLRFLQG
jgi:hypothetical protein